MRQHTDQHMTLWKAQRASLLCLCLGLMVLAPSLAQAASLENPSGGLFYSGIGVISGWKCEANGELTVRFNGGEPIPLVYGSRTWSGWSKKIHKKAEYHPASLDPSFPQRLAREQCVTPFPGGQRAQSEGALWCTS